MGASVAIRVSTLLLSFASRTVFIYVLGAESTYKKCLREE